MKYYTYTLDMIFLNFLAIIILILCFIIVIPIYGNPLIITNIPLMLSTCILYLILHEIIHYFGFIINKNIDRKKVVMGAELEQGILYCMCKQEIQKKDILMSIYAPLTIIGFVTLIIGMLLRLDLLILLSIINISSSIGVIVMGSFIMKLPKNTKYLDLDDPTSFTLISKEDLKNYKFKGIVLKEEGKYNKNICAKNFNKINISKGSKITLIVLIIIIIGGLLWKKVIIIISIIVLILVAVGSIFFLKDKENEVKIDELRHNKRLTL